jgi:hypothetical protein
MSRGDGESETLIFVHIGKTAGSTFNFLIENRFYPGNSFGAYDNNLGHHLRSSTGVYEPATVYEHVREREIERGRPFGFLPGHMRFGLHAYLERPAKYVTFVRDPVERVISAYNYVRSRGWLNGSETLADFVRSDFLGNSDAMVRQLVNDPSLDAAGDAPRRSSARAVTSSDFEEVEANLQQHFLVAAPLSGFDYALLFLARHYRWPVRDLLYVPANVTPGKKGNLTIPQHIRELILERNEWDQKLYTAVTRRFASEVAAFESEAPLGAEHFRETMAAYKRCLTSRWSSEAASSLKSVFKKEADVIQDEIDPAWLSVAEGIEDQAPSPAAPEYASTLESASLPL